VFNGGKNRLPSTAWEFMSDAVPRFMDKWLLGHDDLALRFPRRAFFRWSCSPFMSLSTVLPHCFLLQRLSLSFLFLFPGTTLAPLAS